MTRNSRHHGETAHNEVYSTRDVDCVITTGELEAHDACEKVGSYRLSGRRASILCLKATCGPEFPELMMHPGTSSGSYLHSLIDALTLTSKDELELSVRTVRSSDYEEYTMKKRESGEVVFRGAKCYGFRNLQNIVRKVGRGGRCAGWNRGGWKNG